MDLCHGRVYFAQLLRQRVVLLVGLFLFLVHHEERHRFVFVVTVVQTDLILAVFRLLDLKRRRRRVVLRVDYLVVELDVGRYFHISACHCVERDRELRLLNGVLLEAELGLRADGDGILHGCQKSKHVKALCGVSKWKC